MSKAYKENKVAVQKGAINPAQKTSKMMFHSEKEVERAMELREFVDGGTLKYNEPKK